MKQFVKKAIETLEGIQMLQASFKYQQDLIEEGVFPVKTDSESSFARRSSSTTTTTSTASPLDTKSSMMHGVSRTGR